MTIAVPTTTVSSITVYHHTQDGVKGYMFSVPGNMPQFVTEAEADKLARYMLFEQPEEDHAV